jgi:hypothetical protein
MGETGVAGVCSPDARMKPEILAKTACVDHATTSKMSAVVWLVA